MIDIELFRAELLFHSLGCLLLGLFLAVRRRSPLPFLGAVLMFYWTLYGAWSVAGLHGSMAGSGTDLEEEVMGLDIDYTYLQTIRIYAVFVYSCLLTIGLSWHSAVESSGRPRLSQGRIMALLGITLGLSSVASGVYLVTGIVEGRSAYLVMSDSFGAVRSLFLLANNAAFSVLLALFFHLRSKGASLKILYAALTLLCVENFLLGSRGILFAGLLSSALAAYELGLIERPLRLLIPGVLLLVGMGMSSTLRGLPLNEVSTYLTKADWGTLSTDFKDSNQSEGLAAHLSLYAILKTRVQPPLDSLLSSLAASLIPVTIWSRDRPPTIYELYAREVGLKPEQGFTVHLASSYYMLGGIPGVALGGVMLGMALCLSGALVEWFFARLGIPEASLFNTCVTCSMFGYIPMILRTGFDGYKGYLLSGAIIPLCIFLAARQPTQGESRRS